LPIVAIGLLDSKQPGNPAAHIMPIEATPSHGAVGSSSPSPRRR